MNTFPNPTTWNELDNRFEILDVYVPQEEGGFGGKKYHYHRNRPPLIGRKPTIDNASIRIKHPDLKRPRYFVKSKRGNWYSRYNTHGQQQAEGFIIKDVEHLENLALDWLETKSQGHAPGPGGSSGHEIAEGPDGPGADEKKEVRKWKKRKL